MMHSEFMVLGIMMGSVIGLLFSVVIHKNTVTKLQKGLSGLELSHEWLSKPSNVDFEKQPKPNIDGFDELTVGELIDRLTVIKDKTKPVVVTVTWDKCEHMQGLWTVYDHQFDVWLRGAKE